MSHPQPHDLLLWVRAYRAAAVAALAGLVILLGEGLADRGQALRDFEPERINPNTAVIGSLVRLPGIGKARALDILHYRQTQTDAADGPVFSTPDDLQAIGGIGPKTAENIAPWLTFE
jgi:DNA uptake protein ComE-like DNA-binding protein